MEPAEIPHDQQQEALLSRNEEEVQANAYELLIARDNLGKMYLNPSEFDVEKTFAEYAVCYEDFIRSQIQHFELTSKEGRIDNKDLGYWLEENIYIETSKRRGMFNGLMERKSLLQRLGRWVSRLKSEPIQQPDTRIRTGNRGAFYNQLEECYFVELTIDADSQQLSDSELYARAAVRQLRGNLQEEVAVLDPEPTQERI